MKRKLVFASSNVHKKLEMQQILPVGYELLDLNDIGCSTEIPETADTFEGNATLKSSYVLANYGLDCFADDSGLEVTALNNEPGVYSARYAGGRDPLKNLELVLQKLQGVANREARFKTVISLQLNGKHYLFEGVANGHIINSLRGINGFGYDPIFVPDGYDKTFAELDPEVKNRISHRAMATRKMINFLASEQH